MTYSIKRMISSRQSK